MDINEDRKVVGPQVPSNVQQWGGARGPRATESAPGPTSQRKRRPHAGPFGTASCDGKQFAHTPHPPAGQTLHCSRSTSRAASTSASGTGGSAAASKATAGAAKRLGGGAAAAPRNSRSRSPTATGGPKSSKTTQTTHWGGDPPHPSQEATPRAATTTTSRTTTDTTRIDDPNSPRQFLQTAGATRHEPSDDTARRPVVCPSAHPPAHRPSSRAQSPSRPWRNPDPRPHRPLRASGGRDLTHAKNANSPSHSSHRIPRVARSESIGRATSDRQCSHEMNHCGR